MASDRPKGSTSEVGIWDLGGGIVRSTRFHLHFFFRHSHGGTGSGLALLCLSITTISGRPPAS